MSTYGEVLAALRAKGCIFGSRVGARGVAMTKISRVVQGDADSDDQVLSAWVPTIELGRVLPDTKVRTICRRLGFEAVELGLQLLQRDEEPPGSPPN